MNLTGIISISGKPGLFKVVAQGKNNIIVESLIDGKRSPAYSTDRISALDDISIYTIEDDFPLKEVFALIFKKENGGGAPSHKESLSTLEAYLKDVLPTYDSERVYPSDIKKVFQWYNLLHKADILKLEEEAPEKEADAPKKEGEKAAPKKAAGTKKATTAKSPAAKKPGAPAAKKASTAAKGGAKKSSSAKTASAKKG